MESQEEMLQELLRKTDQRERTARRRALIYSFIPVLLAGLLLWFTGYQIQSASKQVAGLQTKTRELLTQSAGAQAQLDQTQAELTQAQLDLAAGHQALVETQQTLSVTQQQLKTASLERDTLQKQLDELRKNLNDATSLMQLATDFSKYEFTGDWALDLKDMSSLYPEQTRILLSIMALQKTPWKLGGFSPEEGFDSPGFAVYVLTKGRRINVPAGFERTQSSLRALLSPRTGQPRVGDVAFYQAGYTMFYFKTSAGQPFVIGMTPLGVLALKPDFAPATSFGAVFP
jgi:hypothetical protein